MEMIRSRLRKIRSGTKPSTATAIIAVIWNETAISASSQNKKRPSCRDVSGQEKIGGNPTLTQRIKREAYLKAAHKATAKPGPRDQVFDGDTDRNNRQDRCDPEDCMRVINFDCLDD